MRPWPWARVQGSGWREASGGDVHRLQREVDVLRRADRSLLPLAGNSWANGSAFRRFCAIAEGLLALRDTSCPRAQLVSLATQAVRIAEEAVYADWKYARAWPAPFFDEDLERAYAYFLELQEKFDTWAG